MPIKCDVLVIGGGPAGSSAARSAVLSGAKTILIEKKEEIGVNVKCAEGIGEYLFPYLPFEIPKEQLIWKIDGMFFWAEDISIEKRGSFWKGYSVDRSKFDKWLSELAVNNGAEILTNTELTDLELDEENNVKKAIVRRNGNLVEIFPKVIVAADGVESTVLNLLGLYNPKRGDLAEVYSWEMKNLDMYKPHYEQVFTGSFTPSGYAYIFPKSKDVANVGVGGIYPEKKLERYFEEFLEIEHVKKQMKNAEFVVEKTKKTAWRDVVDEWIHGNVLLAGDAANHTLKPLGEGILPGIISGNLAGELSTKKFLGENVNMKIYLKLLENVLHPHFRISRNYLERVHHWFTDKGREKHLLLIALVADLFELERLDELEEMNYESLEARLLEEVRQ